MDADAIIRAAGLTRRFGKLIAVDHLDLVGGPAFGLAAESTPHQDSGDSRAVRGGEPLHHRDPARAVPACAVEVVMAVLGPARGGDIGVAALPLARNDVGAIQPEPGAHLVHVHIGSDPVEFVVGGRLDLLHPGDLIRPQEIREPVRRELDLPVVKHERPPQRHRAKIARDLAGAGVGHVRKVRDGKEVVAGRSHGVGARTRPRPDPPPEAG